MALRNKFIHFKTKASYFAERNKRIGDAEKLKEFDAFTCFVDEGPTIYVFNKEYNCSGGKDDIDASEMRVANAISFEAARAKKREDELLQMIEELKAKLG